MKLSIPSWFTYYYPSFLVTELPRKYFPWPFDSMHAFNTDENFYLEEDQVYYIRLNTIWYQKNNWKAYFLPRRDTPAFKLEETSWIKQEERPHGLGFIPKYRCKPIPEPLLAELMADILTA